MTSSVLTLRLDNELKSRLEKLARLTRRSRSFLAAEAIREYVSVNEWQVLEIKKGLKEADQRNFASKHDIRRVLGKWARNQR
jgi:RHH-type transcriptional regulator, rel operon repressor / antitoxin RelB